MQLNHVKNPLDARRILKDSILLVFLHRIAALHLVWPYCLWHSWKVVCQSLKETKQKQTKKQNKKSWKAKQGAKVVSQVCQSLKETKQKQINKQTNKTRKVEK